jgi:hypothetical protein
MMRMDQAGISGLGPTWIGPLPQTVAGGCSFVPRRFSGID